MSVLGSVVEGCRVVECARQERGDGSLTQGLRGSGGVGRGRSDGGRKRAREAKEKSRRGETVRQIGVRERGRKADGERTRGEGEMQNGGLGVRERCRKAQGERTQGEGEGRTGYIAVTRYNQRRNALVFLPSQLKNPSKDTV